MVTTVYGRRVPRTRYASDDREMTFCRSGIARAAPRERRPLPKRVYWIPKSETRIRALYLKTPRHPPPGFMRVIYRVSVGRVHRPRNHRSAKRVYDRPSFFAWFYCIVFVVAASPKNMRYRSWRYRVFSIQRKRDESACDAGTDSSGVSQTVGGLSKQFRYNLRQSKAAVFVLTFRLHSHTHV